MKEGLDFQAKLDRKEALILPGGIKY